MPTLQEIQTWANTPTGQALQSAGTQIANGANPQAVLASTANQLAQGQSLSDFMATQGGHLLQQYIGAVAGGQSVGNALSGTASAAIGVGLTAGLTAAGVPPPASTLIAGVVGNFLNGIVGPLLHGPLDQTYGALGGDFAWRARKYHTQMLPQAFVTWMESNGYSLSKAITTPPSGESPPWAGLSLALSTWMLQGGWNGQRLILLPGTGANGSGPGAQLGIGYDMPTYAGDGWNIQHSGWWWYPSLNAAEVQAAAAGTLAQDKRGPIWDMYEKAGIDVPATIRNVKAKGSAVASNIIFKQQAYTATADTLETLVAKWRSGKRLTPSEVKVLQDAGILGRDGRPISPAKEKAVGLAAVGLMGLLLR